MKKKELVSTPAIIAIGLLTIVFLGIVGAILFSPANTSDISSWFKTNFFPADEYASISLLDVETETISSQEYQGSTFGAWLLCAIVSAFVLLGCGLFFAKERKLI